ncbi:MAG: tRNA lysidine(34) synthetase TilS [Bacteroidota bacterium]|nr:tRNA lysidine(34) synthetase TilS [Bacteroidota bacterium]
MNEYITRCLHQLKRENPELIGYKDAKWLLAVSGGMDSMCMLYLFTQLQLSIQVLHVNYHLRRAESDRDEKLVTNYCREYNITYLVKSIDMSAVKHADIQTIARQERYTFFQEIAKAQPNSLICTAHNANDSIETDIYRFARGTILNGLTGISRLKEGLYGQAKTIRPILYLKRQEIEAIQKESGFPFIVDSSNLNDDYARNHIRLNVIPSLLKLNSELIDTVNDNSKIRRRYIDYINFLSQDFLAKLPQFESIIEHKKAYFFKIDDSFQYKILMLRHFNFSYKHIYKLISIINTHKNKIPDFKHFYSKDNLYECSKYKNYIAVFPNFADESYNAHLETNTDYTQKFNFADVTISQSESDTGPVLSVSLCTDEVQYPITLRNYKHDDKIQKPGMIGRASVKEVFRERGIPGFLRNSFPVLVNGSGQVIAIAGLICSEQCKPKLECEKKLFANVALRYSINGDSSIPFHEI